MCTLDWIPTEKSIYVCKTDYKHGYALAIWYIYNYDVIGYTCTVHGKSNHTKNKMLRQSLVLGGIEIE